MRRHPETSPHDRIPLVLLTALFIALTSTTPPAPIVVHAEHVLVQAPGTEEVRPQGPAFILAPLAVRSAPEGPGGG